MSGKAEGSVLWAEAEEAGAEIDEAGLAGDEVDGVDGVEVGAAAEEDAGLAEDAEVLGGHAGLPADAGGDFLGHERLAHGELAEDAHALRGGEDAGEGGEGDADGGGVLRDFHDGGVLFVAASRIANPGLAVKLPPRTGAGKAGGIRVFHRWGADSMSVNVRLMSRKGRLMFLKGHTT